MLLHNRNLLVMKRELVVPLEEFVKAFSQIVNCKGYKTYGKKLFKVAEGQLLYNLEDKRKFFQCVVKAGVKEAKPVLCKFFKDFCNSRQFDVNSTFYSIRSTTLSTPFEYNTVQEILTNKQVSLSVTLKTAEISVMLP